MSNGNDNERKAETEEKTNTYARVNGEWVLKRYFSFVFAAFVDDAQP